MRLACARNVGASRAARFRVTLLDAAEDAFLEPCFRPVCLQSERLTDRPSGGQACDPARLANATWRVKTGRSGQAASAATSRTAPSQTRPPAPRRRRWPPGISPIMACAAWPPAAMTRMSPAVIRSSACRTAPRSGGSHSAVTARPNRRGCRPGGVQRANGRIYVADGACQIHRDCRGYDAPAVALRVREAGRCFQVNSSHCRAQPS